MAVKRFRRVELVIRYTWVTIVEVVVAGSTLKLDQRCYSRYRHEEPLTGYGSWKMRRLAQQPVAFC